MEKVLLYEEKIKLTTLSPGPLNPNPVFENYESYNPYPYPYAYQHEDKIKSETEYLALILENEFLKVTILPHLGSRIFSIYDKINKKDLIHKASLANICYLPGTSGGTYVGVGIELSVPDHHSLTNSRKREYSVVENEDGSATVIVGELELRYMMRWAMHFSLRPGVAALFQKVIIHNQSNRNGRFRYWSNAAVSLEGKDVEFILPEKEIWEHGGLYRAFGWPLHDGVDMRYPDKVPHTVGFEGKEVTNGFFAYYDHQNRHGLVHWADPGMVKGKKYWAWGQSAVGDYSASHYADGKKYMEFQSGRDEDQETFEILRPFSTVQWDEAWYPVGALGTVTDASGTLAFALPEKPEKLLSLQSTVHYKELTLALKLKGERVFEKTFPIAPGEIKKIDINALHEIKEKDGISLHFMHDGKRLLSHKIETTEPHDKYMDVICDTSSLAIERTPDYLMSEVRSRMRRFPCTKYVYCDAMIDEILAKDPEHSEALKTRGIFLYEQALYEASEKILRKSLKRNFCDGETYYYLGLINFKKGLYEQAWLEFSAALKFNWWENSFFYMGLIELNRNETEQALELFLNALDYNANHTRARVYCAMLLSSAGRKKEAGFHLEEAHRRFPSDPLAIIGKILLRENTLKNFVNTKEGGSLVVQLHNDIQAYYEIILNLCEIKFYKEALEFLDEIAVLCKYSEGTGMLPFYYHHVFSRLEMKNEISSAIKKIKKLRIETIIYTFPFRHEELEMLSNVLKIIPGNKFADYYKGLILGGLSRSTEAYEHIRKANEAGLKHPIVLNLLGRIAEKTIKNDEMAIEYYEESLGLDPDNIFTRNFLCAVLMRKQETVKIEKLFDNPSTFKNQDMLGKFIAYHKKKGQFDIVIDVLENRVNFPNMTQQLKASFADILISKAIKDIYGKKYDAAIEFMEKAAKQHPQFGLVDKDRKKYNLKLDYFLGKAYKEKGNSALAEKIWGEAITKQENPRDWMLSGGWNYGLWTDRFYQGWMLKELGRTAEAVTYFDSLKALAAHKFDVYFSPKQRKDLMEMAYNGLNDGKIMLGDADKSYLEMT